ncbi:MAG: septum formation protein Maf [Endomicrobiales bacterium]|nr:septum formation protein Maf [Endomicrobiales bacterium]
MKQNKIPVILASASPRRYNLLKQCGLKFSVIPSKIREKTASRNPVSIVKKLSSDKAVSVAKKLEKGIVIGADTIVVLRGSIIGKPRSKKDSKRILSLLNGSYHKVYSGVAVVDAGSGRKKVGCEVSRVKMRKLSLNEIENFSGKHMDKAGAYAVQEKNDAFVERIEGDYFNVVGLPLEKLKKLLRYFGVKLRSKTYKFRPRD